MNMGSWNTGKGLWDMGQGTRDTSSVNGGRVWSGMCGGRKWVTTMGDLEVKPPAHIDNMENTAVCKRIHTPNK